jgi:hypothetical protein
MPRTIERRLDRIEGRLTAGPKRAAEEMKERLALARAKVAVGAVVRRALLRAGIDPACARRLRQADKAAALLAAHGEEAPAPSESDVAGLRLPFDPTRPPDPFEARILALAEDFADGSRPDFGKASFAQLFAWSLVELSAEGQADTAPPSSDLPAGE